MKHHAARYSLVFLLSAASLALGCEGPPGPPGPPGAPAPSNNNPAVNNNPDPTDAGPEDAAPDAPEDVAADVSPDPTFDVPPLGDVTFGDATEPDPDYVCPPWTAPAGLGGPVNAEVTLPNAQRWIDFRRAREQERMMEAWKPAPTRARFRVEQAWITHGCIPFEQAVDLGRALFLRSWTLEEGLGNDLALIPDTEAGALPAPNMRRLQRGRFGGPDATGCFNCHWKGGFAGSGDRADNMFILGDGEDITTHDSRNPPSLWGAGWTELIARELTAELHLTRDLAADRARSTGQAVTVPLTAQGVGFGRLTARPDGQGGVTLDTAQVQGVDADLVIKPFGWKGVFPTLRDFLLQSFQGHMGLQAEEAIADWHTNPHTDLDLGNGPNPLDPDNDGVERELTEGQLTALVLFLATLDTPSIEIPTEGGEAEELADPTPISVYAPEHIVRWGQGASLFMDYGCDFCHKPFMVVRNPRYQTRSALSGALTEVDLAQLGARPLPAQREDGAWLVPTFSDFKRHDMGDWLAGQHDERGVSSRLYMTRRLWGVAQTSPFLHDASATLFDEAIAMHAGPGSEAAPMAQAFLGASEYDKANVRLFLTSLRRAPSIRVR